MYEIFLILFIVIVILYFCLHHHTMKKQHFFSTRKDKDMIREAAKKSRAVSSTISRLDAVIEVAQAKQIMDSLHQRYGPQLASEMTSVDTLAMEAKIQDQMDAVVADLLKLHPELIPPHPFNHSAGFTSNRRRKTYPTSSPDFGERGGLGTPEQQQQTTAPFADPTAPDQSTLPDAESGPTNNTDFVLSSRSY